MKKIFTLMLAAGSITFASAQPGNQKSTSFNNDRKNVKQIIAQPAFEKGKTTTYETYSFSTREKDMQIQKINREYDQRITAIKKNRRMRDQEKSKQIRMLENGRNQEIRQVQLRWEKSNHQNNDWGKNKSNSHY